MPSYKNSNASDTVVDGERITPGQTITTAGFLPLPLPAGVTKTLDTPYFNPTLLSAIVSGSSGDTTISIPAGVTSFELRVTVVAGSVEFYLQSKSNTPSRKVVAGETAVETFRIRACESVIFTILESSSKFKYDVRKF